MSSLLRKGGSSCLLGNGVQRSLVGGDCCRRFCHKIRYRNYLFLCIIFFIKYSAELMLRPKKLCKNISTIKFQVILDSHTTRSVCFCISILKQTQPTETRTKLSHSEGSVMNYHSLYNNGNSGIPKSCRCQ